LVKRLTPDQDDISNSAAEQNLAKEEDPGVRSFKYFLEGYLRIQYLLQFTEKDSFYIIRKTAFMFYANQNSHQVEKDSLA
jgi:hypothetical protein